MARIEVNEKQKTIRIGKTFSKKASVYGSKEYNILHTVKAENPGFTVEVSKRKATVSPLTVAFMDAVVKAENDTAKNDEYTDLKKAVADSGIPYTTEKVLRDWFKKNYPEYKNYLTVDGAVKLVRASITTTPVNGGN